MSGNNGGGRRTKLTPERVKRLCQAIATGATFEIACKYAGIGQTTFYAWLRKAREARDAGVESEYDAVLQGVEDAESKAALRWLTVINKAASEQEDWRPAAWCLERRYPEEYGKKAIQFSGRVDSNLTVENRATEILAERLRELSDAELDAIADDDG